MCKSEIEQKLGLPVKPAKPLTVFFRYMIEIRPKIAAQNPSLKTTEVTKLIAKMWKSLDETEKEKYYEALQHEKIAYEEQMAEYAKLSSKDNKRKVEEIRKELKEEIEKRKNVRSLRKKALEFDKPKRPSHPFWKFLQTHFDRQPTENYKDYIQRKSSEWKSLSESEKEIYKPMAEEWQNYK